MDNNMMTDYVPEGQEGVLFENTHVRDRKFFKEFYFFSFFKRPFFIVFYVLMAISVVANLLSFILADRKSLTWVISSVIYFLVFFFLYKWNIRVAVKRQEELEDGRPNVYITRIFEDRIIYENSLGSRLEVSPTMIKRVNHTKNHLLLRTRANQVFPIQKDGFTKGTYADFCEFLRAKGYKVKG